MNRGLPPGGRLVLLALPIGWARGVSVVLAALLALVALLATEARAAEALPEELKGVTVVERLEQQVDLDLRFTDSTGAGVRLGDLVKGDVPVLLTLNYYSCATLCGVQLNALLDGLKELEWSPGERFRVVTVSIDPNETAALAAAKRDGYLASLGRGQVDWSFLVAEEDQVKTLARQVGFGYELDEDTGQYAHPAVVMFLAPDGKVARYLYGLSYPARDLKFALMESAAGRVGSPVDKLILSCFRYDETAGRYTPAAFGVLRLGGGLTLLLLGAFGIAMWRRERGVGLSGGARVSADHARSTN